MASRPLILRVPNRADVLSSVLDRIARYCRGSGLPRGKADEVRLAVEEILSNLLAHAWPEGGVHDCEVTVTVAGGLVVCDIVDDGVAFDPIAFPSPDIDASLEARPIGGLGLFLVRQMADRVDYARENGRNRLRFEKRFAAPPEASG